MTSPWFAELISGCRRALATLASWGRRRELAELGTVSARWLAEQRSTHPHD